jgi:hypothetical protein
MREPVFKKMVVLHFFTATPMMNMYVKKLGKLRLYIETHVGEIFMGLSEDIRVRD